MANIALLRVSTKGQNLDSQHDLLDKLGVPFEPRFIFEEKYSGKNFDRPVYKAMKQVLRADDVLYIRALNRLGRNKVEMKREWYDIIYNIGADIVVIDCPLLDTRNYKEKGSIGSLVSDLALAILSHMAEEELVEKKRAAAAGYRSG